MAYTHTTFADLKTQLAERLGDSTSVFWVDAELTVLLTEALRTFGLCSGFWRDRGTIPTTSATAFYDICTLLSGSLLNYTVTDRDIIQALQYHLLEPATSQAVWFGTEMFNIDVLRYAIQRRRDQFLADTGIVVNRSLLSIIPNIGRQQLLDSTIDVRRAAWLGAAPTNYYNPLWREDERLLTMASQTWSVDLGTPEMYSIMAPPPLEIQLAPPPISSGQVELLTVDSGAALDPANTATVLGIPDDLTPAIKWGALADLLGIDGIAADPVRAQFAEQRYQQYVQLARTLPVVMHAEINGVPLIPCTLQELESSTPNWQNSSAPPTDIALAAPNLIALNPVPNDVYSITLDVVSKTPIPANGAASVQIGREQLDAILDYAEHLALFKSAGTEWHATERQASNFLAQAITYNQRISAAARAVLTAAVQSQRQKQEIPRRVESWLQKTFGTGALNVGTKSE